MPEPREVSKYNDAELSISRLHNIWLACRYFRKSGNLASWQNELDIAFDELYHDVLRHPNKKKLIEKYHFHLKRISKSNTKNTKYFLSLIHI